MEKLRIALIDDEKASLSIISASIRSLLEKYTSDYSIVEYIGTEDAEEIIKNAEYDLIFCDIEMPIMDGITFCSKYKQAHENVTIIFISNREDLIFDSLTVNPFGFIRKRNFIQDISIIMNNYFKALKKEKKEKSLVIKSKGQIVSIALSKIIYIESDRKYQKIYVINNPEPIIVAMTMMDFTTALEKDGFIITHKAFIVNYIYIQEILMDTVLLKNGKEILMSRRKSQEVKDKYLQLIKNDSNVIFRM